MGHDFLSGLSHTTKSIGHTFTSGTKSIGNSIKSGASSAGHWLKGAGDTVLGAVGTAGKSILGDLENLTNPTFLMILAAGIGVVGLVVLLKVMKSK